MTTEERATVRFTPGVTWFCTALPLIAFLVFLTMAVHVRLSLGHWPTEALGSKDKSLGLAFHEFIWIVMLFAGGFAAVPLWLVLLLFTSSSDLGSNTRGPSAHPGFNILYSLGWPGPFANRVGYVVC